MAHKVVKKFKDLQDGDFVYEVGDEFPREGQKVTKKRLEELSNSHPQYGVSFVEEYESDEERAEREAMEAEAKAKEEAEKKKNEKTSAKKEDKKQE